MIFTPLTSGKSVEGAEIEAFKTDIKSNKYIYLLAGTHGDEVEGVWVLKELFEWLRTEHSTGELPLVVIPILNVDGYRMGSRTNAHGVDLNRNYPSQNWTKEARKEKYNPGPSPLSEPENEFLIKLFDKFPPGIVLSFHTWKPLINYNGKAKEVAEFISTRNGYAITEDIGYPTPGSLGTFLPEKYQAPVVTFECPEITDELSLNDIWKKNEPAFKSLMQSALIKNYIED